MKCCGKRHKNIQTSYLELEIYDEMMQKKHVKQLASRQVGCQQEHVLQKHGRNTNSTPSENKDGNGKSTFRRCISMYFLLKNIEKR